LLDDKFDPKRAFDNESFPVEEEERIETVIRHCHFLMLSSGDSTIKSSIETRFLPSHHALAGPKPEQPRDEKVPQ
jgi:hypothetical protein